MALTFRGTSIPGIHSGSRPPSPDPNVTRVVTSGLNGATEVRGGTGTTQIDLEVTLYNSYSTAADCLAAIASVNALQNKNGTLVITGPNAQTLPYCTLDRVEILREPIPVTGATTISPSTYNGWMAVLRLLFTKLRA